MKNFLLGVLITYTVALTAFTLGMCHGKIGVAGQAQVQYSDQPEYMPKGTK
jgi:hypothetical protein